jgi:hypothetical protein
LLADVAPAVALRRWMDVFGDWIATKNGMLDTLLTLIESDVVGHARTRDEILNAISSILDAGRAAGDLRPDVTAEEVAASLIGIFTVAHQPGHAVTADRLLDILLDGLRPQEHP